MRTTQFANFGGNIWAIDQKTFMSYYNRFPKESDGPTMSRNVAIQWFSKSQLPAPVLGAIWQLCCKANPNSLTRIEFVHATHFLRIYQQIFRKTNHKGPFPKLPAVLPPYLEPKYLMAKYLRQPAVSPASGNGGGIRLRKGSVELKSNAKIDLSGSASPMSERIRRPSGIGPRPNLNRMGTGGSNSGMSPMGGPGIRPNLDRMGTGGSNSGMSPLGGPGIRRQGSNGSSNPRYAQIAQLENDVMQQEKQKSQYQSQIEQTNISASELSTKLMVYKQKLSVNQERIKELLADLNKSKEKHNKIRQQVEQVQQQLGGMQQKKIEIQNETARLNQETIQLQQVFHEYRKQLTNDAEILKLKEAFLQAQNQKQMMTIRVNEVKEANTARKNQINDLRSQIQTIQSETSMKKNVFDTEMKMSSDLDLQINQHNKIIGDSISSTANVGFGDTQSQHSQQGDMFGFGDAPSINDTASIGSQHDFGFGGPSSVGIETTDFGFGDKPGMQPDGLDLMPGFNAGNPEPNVQIDQNQSDVSEFGFGDKPDAPADGFGFGDVSESNSPKPQLPEPEQEVDPKPSIDPVDKPVEPVIDPIKKDVSFGLLGHEEDPPVDLFGGSGDKNVSENAPDLQGGNPMDFGFGDKPVPDSQGNEQGGGDPMDFGFGDKPVPDSQGNEQGGDPMDFGFGDEPVPGDHDPKNGGDMGFGLGDTEGFGDNPGDSSDKKDQSSVGGNQLVPVEQSEPGQLGFGDEADKQPQGSKDQFGFGDEHDAQDFGFGDQEGSRVVNEEPKKEGGDFGFGDQVGDKAEEFGFGSEPANFEAGNEAPDFEFDF